ncbi:MAG TPA: amino acid permease, partial [Pirellulaceae bacterium]|nr:amino acid permease [Pirellulaceae bacterium]
MSQLFAKKSLKVLLADMESDNRLKRALGPVTLTSLGIGAVIGAGIFAATGAAAHNTAGPALMVSYMVAGLACIFAALCYAEFASMAPVAGSAYTYAYTTMGELFAWIIGWDLVLEYAVGASTVANAWSGYFQKVLKGIGIHIPEALGKAPLDWNHDAKWGDPANWITFTGSYVNLPAVIIVAIVTAILVKGISESAGFNALMVFIKVAAVLFVVLVGAFYINPANWTQVTAPDGRYGFAPYGWGGFSFFGIKQLTIGQVVEGRPVGMLAGAALIFFAYIGFDSVSTHAEEAKNPKRDVPIGIVASLVICTILYVAVVAVLTGMVPYYKIDINAGVSSAFAERGLKWAEFIVATAGVAGITSVLLVMMLSGPRVFLAMARDGLVPKAFFADVHPTFRTPWKSTIAIGIFVAVLAGLLPINALLELTNIGTLFAFVVVCAAVLVMRRINPEAHRPFRCPLVPVIPVLGILLCLMLMMSLPVGNWMRLFGWMIIGLIIYFSYS